jgi:hypothetical protein
MELKSGGGTPKSMVVIGSGQSTPLKSFMSMSSMQSEHNAGEMDMQTRVFSLNFPSVFNYVQPPQRREEVVQISQEEKDQILIFKNREALDRQMKIHENHAVNVTEDSISSDMLPHSRPPQSLSCLDASVTPVKMVTSSS